MSFAEAQYAIDEILDGLKSKQATGLEPNNVSNVKIKLNFRDDGMTDLEYTYTLRNTIVDNELLCGISKCTVVFNKDRPPKNPTDGTKLADDNMYGNEKNVSRTISSMVFNDGVGYLGFFPVSDHGVVNRNPANVYNISKVKNNIYGFHEDFTDSNPVTRITYIEANEGFQPIRIISTLYDLYPTLQPPNPPVGEASMVDWMTWPWLKKVKPYMVKADAQADYQLNPDDYSKKLDGTASDIINSSSANTYSGPGAFVWFPRLYMKEVYAADGNSRDVYFSEEEFEGSYPVGFEHYSDGILEGLWIPMFYSIYRGNNTATLGTKSVPWTTAKTNYNINQWNAVIKATNPRAAFLGGPILNVIRDLLIMLGKSSNVQSAFGTGRSGYGGSDVLGYDAVSKIVDGGIFYGTIDQSTEFNKIFHSIPLGTYQYTIRDPYIFCKVNDVRVCANYYPLNDASIFNGDVLDHFETTDFSNFVVNTAAIWPSKMIYVGQKIGSFPLPTSSGGSASLCYGDTWGAAVDTSQKLAGRWGSSNQGQSAGPVYTVFTIGLDANGVLTQPCLLILPPAGYKPE